MSEREGHEASVPTRSTRSSRRLSERLASEGESAHLFVVGGAAMALAYDRSRVTRDVDALLIPVDAVRRLASEIGVARGLESDWLNDAAKGFLPGNEIHPQTVFESEWLRVDIPSTEYLLAMKLYAGRDERDFDDAATLMNAAGLTTGDEARAVLVQHYGESRLQAKHQYIPDEVATRAAELRAEATHEGAPERPRGIEDARAHRDLAALRKAGLYRDPAPDAEQRRGELAPPYPTAAPSPRDRAAGLESPER
ncbi:hypothetical protein [Clavibacter tessellarius]|uniref:hypothetical protein n=1 Tax=Clavibacter tessellarius TaxID=31965 RepID=UPI00324F4D71